MSFQLCLFEKVIFFKVFAQIPYGLFWTFLKMRTLLVFESRQVLPELVWSLTSFFPIVYNVNSSRSSISLVFSFQISSFRFPLLIIDSFPRNSKPSSKKILSNFFRFVYFQTIYSISAILLLYSLLFSFRTQMLGYLDRFSRWSLLLFLIRCC